MINVKKILTKHQLLVAVIVIILGTLPLYINLLRPGFFPMQDDLQAFRIHQMDKCIQDLQIPCRWVPDAGYQYGYPQFNYYPPSVYYLGELFHLVGFQFIDAVKILFVLGYVFSALGMFLLLRAFLGNFSAVFGALFYSYVPYKAVEVYVRGAMSEFWALVIFPLVFWASYQLIKTKKIKYLAFFALLVGLLLTTHNLMSIIFLPLVIIWCLSWIFLEKDWKILPKLILSGLLGVGFASFFSLPVFFEKPYAHLETLLGGYFGYEQHFVNLQQLFISNYWGYGSSVLGSEDDLSLSTGPIHALFALIGLFIAIWRFKKSPKLSSILIVLFLTSLGVLFLIHVRSSFIWKMIGFLEWLQFPWRILANSIFLLSVISAIGLQLIPNVKARVGVGFAVLALVVVLHAGFFKPVDWLNISDKDKFSGKSWDKQLTISIFDYLPIYAEFPPITQAPEKPEVLDGDIIIKSYSKGSNYQQGEIIVEKEATIRLPLFDYPGMKVTVDGKKVNHWNDDCRLQEFCLGLITFQLPPGNYKIRAELTNTPIRTVGNVISLVSMILIISIFIYSYRRRSSK